MARSFRDPGFSHFTAAGQQRFNTSRKNFAVCAYDPTELRIYDPLIQGFTRCDRRTKPRALRILNSFRDEGTGVVNFLVLPPEINSARMYLGAGSGPMLSAGAAWDELAGELGAAANGFESVTSGLAGAAWQGPAAAAMARAAAPYVGWLSAASAQAQGAAGQARAAASAFEAAVSATVHPTAVLANRNQLVSLVVSNLFGQNAPAIAAAEGQYEQMWAQDVAAMVGYHGGASAVAEQLTPLQQVLGAGSLGNLGSGDLGGGNHGDANVGSGNRGSRNVGSGNFGDRNFGDGNAGNGNVGFGNRGGQNVGLGNIGTDNMGNGNAGIKNFGVGNQGNGNIGTGNLGRRQRRRRKSRQLQHGLWQPRQQRHRLREPGQQ